MPIRVIVPLFVLLVAGCGKSSGTLPELHSVKGGLVQSGKAVSGGFVRFMPDKEGDFIVQSEVDAAGKFELQTVANSQKRKGAPAGSYSVTYTPPGTDHKIAIVTTKGTVSIVPGTHDLSVDLDR